MILLQKIQKYLYSGCGSKVACTDNVLYGEAAAALGQQISARRFA
jgi:hypothetical protein